MALTFPPETGEALRSRSVSGMTTKTPSGLATGGAGSDDETIDDSLDEILLRANEKPAESSMRSVMPKVQMPRATAMTILGLPAPSLPIPGSSVVGSSAVPDAPAAEPPEITP